MKHLVSIGIGVLSFGGTALARIRLSTCVLFTFLLAQVALAAPADDFVTTWKTDNPGTSNSTSITVPMIGGLYDVDWDNDGVFDQFDVTDSITHNFGVAGTYTIRIFGSYRSIYFNNRGDEEKILSLDQWGTGSWTDMEGAFNGAVNLLIPAIDTPDFSAVTNMSYMFMYATSANPDTSGWDISLVTNMRAMFLNATSANPDTSSWDTSSVTDMSQMFWYTTSADPDTSGWDTSVVADMSGMFNNASSASPDTSGWDTSLVTNMREMFTGAISANPDTSGWDTSSVTHMQAMFGGATSADPDTSGWDTSSVTNMSFMFHSATLANPDTSVWDTSLVRDMAFMFRDAITADPDTGDWDTSSVTQMRSMFNGAISFDRDIGSWSVTALRGAPDMFDGVTLSTANYESLLIGWNAQPLRPGVFFDGGNSNYCSAEAAAARANMIASDSWVITDGGQSCPPVTVDLIFSDGFEDTP